MGEHQTRWRTGAIYVLLAFITVAVYAQLAGFDFVNMDDDRYVMANPHLPSGLTLDRVRWAFTTIYFSNWHPLTWLSYLLDYQLFGLNPHGYHLTNVALHTLNVLLLLAALNRLTGNFGRSAWVAALFAVHPLHVESVAWIAERKDVLSTFFLFLTFLFYARYVERRTMGSYLLVALSFALGLMAKPMLVTLPCLLLLLDYWPLGRFQKDGTLAKCLVEKAPLFILSAASCAVTLVAQHRGGNIISLEVFPFSVRLMNAAAAYIGYLAKTLYPFHLAVFYPHPSSSGHIMPLWRPMGAAVLLLAISVLALYRLRKQPYLAMGWFWYLGTLVPVIGIIQVGAQAMADRYTYVPLIGIFIIIAWGLGDFGFWILDFRLMKISNLESKIQNLKSKIATGVATVLVGALALLAWHQAQSWRNSITLFEHAIQVTDNNYFAHNNLGGALLAEKRYKEAEAEYRKAIGISPGYAEAYNNLGSALASQERYEEAAAPYRMAIKINPGYVNAHCNLGGVSWELGRVEDAVAEFKKVLELDPQNSFARQALDQVDQKGRHEQPPSP